MTRSEPNLRIPGPTSLPQSVRDAGARQMINHRGPEFKALLERVQAGMKPFFGTMSDIALLTTAGTGGLEAAIVNTLSPGDRVLGVSIGAFGDRFAKIAEAYGATVDKVAAEWGWAARPDEVRERLIAGGGDYRAVLLTHNETSTGVMNPIPALAAAIREVAPDALILVDTVSSLGAVPFEMDAWGIDVVATASQKAWMSAPGLAMVAASPRARAAMETARMPRFYLDLRKHFEAAATGETPWTPAVAVAFQVDEGIRLLHEEGMERVFERHVACAAATQAGLETLGFRLVAEPAHRSKTVTAAWLPEGVDWKDFNGRIKQRGVVLAGGQGQLTGKIFRVGHLGQVEVTDIVDALLAIEEVMLELDLPVERGAAIAAADRAAAGAALQPA
ncbi:MAG TPA: alanine--glyoxylate aminotransferase family protein [Candidatus Binatia bacterium]|nr:alanine--glyoxylate aminotransferase family protein [Candidatus Binatia bacterium]